MINFIKNLLKQSLYTDELEALRNSVGLYFDLPPEDIYSIERFDKGQACEHTLIWYVAGEFTEEKILYCSRAQHNELVNRYNKLIITLPITLPKTDT